MNGFPTIMSKALDLVMDTLNLLASARKPSLCFLSRQTYSGLLLTVLRMMTFLSWPWNSSVVPTMMSDMFRSLSLHLSF